MELVSTYFEGWIKIKVSSAFSSQSRVKLGQSLSKWIKTSKYLRFDIKKMKKKKK